MDTKKIARVVFVRHISPSDNGYKIKLDLFNFFAKPFNVWSIEGSCKFKQACNFLLQVWLDFYGFLMDTDNVYTNREVDLSVNQIFKYFFAGIRNKLRKKCALSWTWSRDVVSETVRRQCNIGSVILISYRSWKDVMCS